jgi:hypothetical protein
MSESMLKSRDVTDLRYGKEEEEQGKVVVVSR